MKYVAFLEDGTYGELDSNDFHGFGDEGTITVFDESGSAAEVRGAVEEIAVTKKTLITPDRNGVDLTVH